MSKVFVCYRVVVLEDLVQVVHMVVWVDPVVLEGMEISLVAMVVQVQEIKASLVVLGKHAIKFGFCNEICTFISAAWAWTKVLW